MWTIPETYLLLIDHLSNNIYVLTSNAELLKILDDALPRFIEIQENSNACLVWSDKSKTNLSEFNEDLWSHFVYLISNSKWIREQ